MNPVVADPTPPDAEKAVVPRQVLRRRVIALGLPLTLGAFWLVVQIEQVQKAGMPTSLALYYHVVAALLVLVMGNALLRRVAPQAALTQGELLCLYSMMAVGSAFACWEMLGTLIPALAFPARWKAVSPDRNSVGALVLRLLPGPVLLRDPEAAGQLFNGSRPWEAVRLAPWLMPLVLWGALLALTQAMAAAAGRLLYPRWAHGEKVSFPLVALPLAVTEPGARLWRNWLFWMAFGIVFALDISNGVHLLYPSWPEIVVKMPLWLNTSPRNPAEQGMGAFPVSMHPLMLGIAFLLPTDLLFSGWFFFVLGKLQVYLAGTQNMVEGEGCAGSSAGTFPACWSRIRGLSWCWGSPRWAACCRKPEPSGSVPARESVTRVSRWGCWSSAVSSGRSLYSCWGFLPYLCHRSCSWAGYSPSWWRGCGRKWACRFITCTSKAPMCCCRRYSDRVPSDPRR
jgi:hypothetical protein